MEGEEEDPFFTTMQGFEGQEPGELPVTQFQPTIMEDEEEEEEAAEEERVSEDPQASKEGEEEEEEEGEEDIDVETDAEEGEEGEEAQGPEDIDEDEEEEEGGDIIDFPVTEVPVVNEPISFTPELPARWEEQVSEMLGPRLVSQTPEQEEQAEQRKASLEADIERLSKEESRLNRAANTALRGIGAKREVSTEPDFRVLTTNLLAKNEKEGEKDSKQEKLITFLGQELTRQKSFSEQAEMKMREDEKHIRELLAQNVAIRRQLEEVLQDKSIVSQEHAALLSETNEAQHALQIALQERGQFERDILRLQSQLSDAETSAHSLQRQLSLAHSNLDELKAEIEDLRATATAAGLTEEELPERRQLHRTVPIKRLITGQVALNVNTDFLEGLSLEQQIRLSQEEYVTPEKDEPLQLISVS